MSKSAPDELRSLWLQAVLLPGESDPRASCLRELAEYTGRNEDEVQRLCEGAIDAQRERFARHLFGIDIASYSGLDLIVNTDTLDVNAAASMIESIWNSTMNSYYRELEAELNA